jgi:hypothetical protein
MGVTPARSCKDRLESVPCAIRPKLRRLASSEGLHTRMHVVDLLMGDGMGARRTSDRSARRGAHGHRDIAAHGQGEIPGALGAHRSLPPRLDACRPSGRPLTSPNSV